MSAYIAQSLEHSAQAAAGILALMLLLILASVLALVVINPARPFGPLLLAFFTPIKQQKDKNHEALYSQAQLLPHQTPPAYPTWERQHHQPGQPPLESDLLWLLSHLHPPERQQSPSRS